MITKSHIFIDGNWVEPLEQQLRQVTNPATEEPSAMFAAGGVADVDRAVAAAKRAFDNWSTSDPGYRLAFVERLLEIYTRRGPDIAAAISLEMGAPVDLALERHVAAGAFHITNFINAFRTFEFERPLGPHAPNDRIIMDPIGVVGLITPWNWPMNQVTLKVIPALLAGCTMVLKPAEIAPLSSLVFAELIDEARVPKGVFNLVNGNGAVVGAHLSQHPDVEMISFTGSTRAGIAISTAAAPTLKRVSLELGGKGANIVFADADADAVKRGVLHCFTNTGQSCNAPTRMLVERSVYDAAVETAKKAAEEVEVGLPSQRGKHIGPLASAAQFQKVQELIQKGIDEGARLVVGGLGRPSNFDRGYFVRPTIFADVDNRMTIAQEEIFGPVLCMTAFDTEDHAIQLANDTPYGLSNYVQTQDGAKRNRVALRLRSGMVEMNGRPRGAGAPFGGVKASGRAREGGVWGIEEFLEPKAVSDWANIEADRVGA
ncbi:aldehyde dehydrogenase family protein [Agrobacterium sp. LAD9]|uniref:aldehyde dehydrogenase family protein n=1 Tax=Agrobacterium sp. LAD9 TaxID=2055153 RepID=UPI000D1DD9F0